MHEFEQAWTGATSVLLLLLGTATFAKGPEGQVPEFAAMPQGLTSFGAARIGDAVYIYGGHTGNSHSYSTAEQSKQLLKLDLKTPGSSWQVVSEGQRLQGLALVAFEHKLISVGGFQAKNQAGQEQDLHSQAMVSVFDTQTGTWSELPAMPTPRSSHDAIVVGTHLYVVGGWNMSTPDETEWDKTALVMDLSQDDPQWRMLPAPPFQRRALVAAAHDGKLFVIGGMNQAGGPTRDVAIYDPATEAWTNGPEIVGKDGMAGFGAAAWSLGHQLVVSNYSGDVQVLGKDATSWEIIGKTQDARFFHRLVALDEHQLLALGGASMDSGKFLTPEVIQVK